MNQTICPIHEKQFLFHVLDEYKQQQKEVCLLCFQDSVHFSELISIEESLNNKHDQIHKKNIQTLILILNNLRKLSYDTLKILEKTQNRLFQQTISIEKHYNEQKENQNTVASASNDFQQAINKKFQETQIFLSLELQKIQVNFRVDSLLEQINSIGINSILEQNSREINLHSLNNNIKGQQQNFQQEFEQVSQAYKFNKNFVVEQEEECSAIVFNKDETQFVAGCNEKMKIFQVNDGNLKEIQILDTDWNFLSCALFVERNQSLLTGMYDRVIIEWKKIEGFWEQMRVYSDHEGSLSCMILSQDENLLITGCLKNTVKFWNYQDNKWLCNQTINCGGYVYSISLNKSVNILVQSGEQKFINVIQHQENQWQIIQQLNVEEMGFRVSFLSNDQFCFLPHKKNLQFFKFDQEKQKFKKNSELQLYYRELNDRYFFPIVQGKQGLIMVKSSNFIHIIKQIDSGEFEIEQIIQFHDPDQNKNLPYKTFNLYGGVSQSGHYLATWDEFTKQIQLRQLSQMID